MSAGDERIDAIRERLARFTASVEAYGAVTKANSEELYVTAASDIAYLLVELEQVERSEARLTHAAKQLVDVMGPCETVDHHGNCQSHFAEFVCSVALLRSIANKDFRPRSDRVT